MKKTFYLLTSAVVALASCTKPANNTTNNTTNTTVISALPSFTVNGVTNVELVNGSITDEASLSLTVAYNDSVQNWVTLSLSSLPAGIAIDTPWVNAGFPTFSTSITFLDTSSAGATPGSYPMTLTATSSANETRTYTFNVVVKPQPPCTQYIVGKYVDCIDGCTSPSYYTDSVYNDASVTNKIWFNNFANLGIKIYGNYNCNTEALTIPSQTVGGIIYQGTGWASGHYMSLSYTAGASSCSCTLE